MSISEPRDQLRNSVSPCFHPGDDSPEGTGTSPAASWTDGGNFCHHPADDLAADLHLCLTGSDERELAALARSGL